MNKYYFIFLKWKIYIKYVNSKINGITFKATFLERNLLVFFRKFTVKNFSGT